MADVLLDSNVLARFLDADNQAHREASEAVQELARAGKRLCLVPQCTVELANFLTRPARENGFGLSPSVAAEKLDELEQTFTLRFPDAQVEHRLFRLLHRELQISGKQVHDLRLMAACSALGIDTLVTLNARHFVRSGERTSIKVTTPEQVLADAT